MMKANYLIVVLLLSACCFTGCAVNPVSGDQDLVFLSERDELALGRKANRQILNRYEIYDNRALQAYVKRVGKKVAEKSHRNDLIYRFTVLDSKEVNAFALPGGYIYITRGLLAYLKSEAELAAVLGHEVGHVTARHAVRQHSANQLTNLGVRIGSIFIPGASLITSQVTGLLSTALLRGYGRGHELEADQLGAEYLARTGYDPNAMLDVISVLKDQEVFEKEAAAAEGREPRVYHGVFSTHPDNDTRLKEVVDAANKLAEDNASAKYVGQKEYLGYMNKLIYGESAHGGILRGRQFLHADLNFAMTFPEGWHVKNQPDRLLLTAPGGSALIQILTQDVSKKISPRDFILQHVASTIEQGAKLNINGHKAYTGIVKISVDGKKKPARVVVIYDQHRAYIVAGVSKTGKHLDKYNTDILATAKSYHKLTATERRLAHPLRLSIIQAKKQTRFKDLAAKSILKSHAESKLRLLNGMYPDGEPQKGQLLKIVE